MTPAIARWLLERAERELAEMRELAFRTEGDLRYFRRLKDGMRIFDDGIAAHEARLTVHMRRAAELEHVVADLKKIAEGT